MSEFCVLLSAVNAVDEASHRGLVSDGRTAIVSSQQIENNTTPRK